LYQGGILKELRIVLFYALCPELVLF